MRVLPRQNVGEFRVLRAELRIFKFISTSARAPYFRHSCVSDDTKMSGIPGFRFRKFSPKSRLLTAPRAKILRERAAMSLGLHSSERIPLLELPSVSSLVPSLLLSRRFCAFSSWITRVRCNPPLPRNHPRPR